MLRAIKVRLYPTTEQQMALSRSFGCARWYWNFALNACIQHYEQTGKKLAVKVYKGMLPQLKIEHPWLKEDCYSSVLQCIALNLEKAFKNFFEGRARFPRFKSKYHKQSIQYPQNVKRCAFKGKRCPRGVAGGSFPQQTRAPANSRTVIGYCLKVPKIGEIKAVFHRAVTGKIKTVTIGKTPTDKYFAAILYETPETENKPLGDKTLGIDLGLKDFAIVHDGEQVAKYSNPKHLKRHEKNLARKQKKLARKTKGSKSRNKFKKLVAKVHERVSNSRQDFLHKLSRKLVNESQVIAVENLNVKGMVRNRKLAKSISDVGWGMFVNFLDYKLKHRDGQLVEVGRFFPSSKKCFCCGHVVDELPLNVREWDCPACGIHHDRDENASKNIRAEGIRILQENGGGNPVIAVQRRSKTNKPQGGKASVNEAGSPHLLEEKCG